jgi:hypothetical protein
VLEVDEIRVDKEMMEMMAPLAPSHLRGKIVVFRV